ncbi:hypothetical protein F4825DRAFT_264768 [Nemania diffusa]|nr:hypothetical protein F4825DRAFT_264768 [Nemania diffusa]
MDFSQNQRRRPLVRDLASLGDAELDRYLQEFCRHGNITLVEVDDPENLPESFIQRLRDQAQGASLAPRSHAIDLDQVTARLLELPADDNRQPRSYVSGPEDERETQPATPSDVLEKKAYNKLVDNGGRPLFPIHRFDDIARNLRAHHDMLRPWLYWPDQQPQRLEVFNAQLFSWDCFQKWQMYIRGCGVPEFVGRSELDTFLRHFRRRTTTYTEAVKKLLTQYEFIRPFQLHDDPKQQNKVTTWIEYIAFACSIHYHFACLAKKYRSGFDKGWEALVETGVLRSWETQEYICDAESSIAHDRETHKAWEDVSLAEKALISAKKDSGEVKGSSCAKEAADISIRAAQSRLDEAKKSHAVLQRRNKLTVEFSIAARPYLIAKEDEKRHHLQLQWIFEQFPLVEAEMNQPAASEGTQNNSTRGTKRVRDTKSAEPQNRGTKKRKPNPHSTGGSNDIVSLNDNQNSKEQSARPIYSNGGFDNTKRASGKEKRSLIVTRSSNGRLLRSSNQQAHQPLATSPPLRRSARIAALQKVRENKTTIAPETKPKQRYGRKPKTKLA